MIKNCPVCNNPFKSLPSAFQKTCSLKCRSFDPEWIKSRQGIRGQFVKGQTAWNKNKKMNYSEEAKIKQNRFGYKHTEATKQKMRLINSLKKKSRSQHSQWKGGITSLNNRIRTCRRYYLWRNSILLDDNYTCRFCGKRGGKLHVDHIVPFAMKMRVMKINSFQEAMDCMWLWETNGGRTLCIPCHRQTRTHGYHRKEYGKPEGYNYENYNTAAN